MGAGLIIFEADRLLELLDGLVELSHPSEAHSHVEVGQILVVSVRQVLQRLLIVSDTLLQFVQLPLHLRSIEVVNAVGVVFFHGGLVVAEGLLVLTQLKVALTRKVPMISYVLYISTLVR